MSTTQPLFATDEILWYDNGKWGEVGYAIANPGGKIFTNNSIYRWGTGSEHLSGISDGSSRPHQAHWDALGKRPIVPGKFTIRPHWRRDYLACAQGFSTS